MRSSPGIGTAAFAKHRRYTQWCVGVLTDTVAVVVGRPVSGLTALSTGGPAQWRHLGGGARGVCGPPKDCEV